MNEAMTPYSLAVGTVAAAFNPPEVQVMLSRIAAGDTSVFQDDSRARSTANHFNLALDIGLTRHIQCNINVRSFSKFRPDADPDLRYFKLDDFTDASTLALLSGRQPGLHTLGEGQSILYENLIDLSRMVLLDEEPDANGETTLVRILRQVIHPAFGGNGRVFVFGHAYAGASGVSGIHDVHMNHTAGQPPSTPDDGLLVVDDGAGNYTALFIAFDTQFHGGR